MNLHFNEAFWVLLTEVESRCSSPHQSRDHLFICIEKASWTHTKHLFSRLPETLTFQPAWAASCWLQLRPGPHCLPTSNGYFLEKQKENTEPVLLFFFFFNQYAESLLGLQALNCPYLYYHPSNILDQGPFCLT